MCIFDGWGSSDLSMEISIVYSEMSLFSSHRVFSIHMTISLYFLHLQDFQDYKLQFIS